MNILQILDELEKLLTEILLWIVFIPKTLLKILTNPNWVSPYITEELEKPNDRFRNYMSPIILFLVNSLLLFFLFEYIIYRYGGFGFLPDGMKKVLNFNNVGDVESKLKDVNTLWMAIGFMLLPIVFAIFFEFLRKGKFTRELVKRSIYIQSYFFSPILFVYFASIIFYNLLPFDPIVDFTSYLLFLLSLIWFSIVQIRFLSQEIPIHKLKASLLYMLLLFFLSIGYIAYDGITTLSSRTSNSSVFHNIILPKTGTYDLSIKHRWFGSRDYRVIVDHSNSKYGKNIYHFADADNRSSTASAPLFYEEGDTLDIDILTMGDAIYYDILIHFENEYGIKSTDSIGNEELSTRIIPDSLRYFIKDEYQVLPTSTLLPGFAIDRLNYSDEHGIEKITWQATVFGISGLIFKILWFVIFLFLLVTIIFGVFRRRKKSTERVPIAGEEP